MKNDLINVIAGLLSLAALGVGAAIFWFIDFACGIEDTSDCSQPSHIISLWFWRSIITLITLTAIWGVFKLAKKFKTNEKRTGR